MSRKEDKSLQYLTRQHTGGQPELRQEVDTTYRDAVAKASAKGGVGKQGGVGDEPVGDRDTASDGELTDWEDEVVSGRGADTAEPLELGGDLVDLLRDGENLPGLADNPDDTSVRDILEYLEEGDLANLLGDEILEAINMGDEPVTLDKMTELLEGDRKRSNRVEPEKYGGTSKENASSWLRKFNQYADLTKMSENDKIGNFGLLLKGMADIWFDSYYDRHKQGWADKATKNTLKENEKWNEIEQAFKDKFGTNKHCNLHKLHNIKFTDFKNSEAYTNHIQQIGSTLGLEDDALIPYVMNGLPEDLYARVASHEPRTLAEHISRVALEDTLLKMSKPKPEVKALETSDDKKIAALADAIIIMNDKLSELTASTGQVREEMQNHQRRGGDGRRGGFRGRRDGRKCYNCNRPGHFARDCRSKQNGNGGGRGRGNNWRGNNSRGPRFDNQNQQSGNNGGHQGNNGDGEQSKN